MNKKDPKYVYNGLLTDGVHFLQNSNEEGFSIAEISENTGIPQGLLEKFMSFEEPMDHHYFMKFNGFCGMLLEETIEKDENNSGEASNIRRQKYNVLLAEGLKLLNLKFPVAHLSQKMGIERSRVKTMVMHKIPVTKSFYDKFARIYEIDKLKAKDKTKKGQD